MFTINNLKKSITTSGTRYSVRWILHLHDLLRKGKFRFLV